jgi:hypothetical protein
MAGTREEQETRAAMRRYRRELAVKFYRDRYATIRADMARIKERRRELLAAVRVACGVAAARAREAVKRRKAEARAALARELKEFRQAERNRCAARKFKVNLATETALQRVAREKRELRDIQRRERGEAAIKKRHERSTRRERRQESDDEVRGNLEPELVPIFDRVKRSIRDVPGKSRTEAFLEWVHDNPEHVAQIRDEGGEAETKRLVRELQKAEREKQKAIERAEKEGARTSGKPTRPAPGGKKLRIGGYTFTRYRAGEYQVGKVGQLGHEIQGTVRWFPSRDAFAKVGAAHVDAEAVELLNAHFRESAPF